MITESVLIITQSEVMIKQSKLMINLYIKEIVYLLNLDKSSLLGKTTKIPQQGAIQI